MVTIVWIVGITNAFNLLDNMDGLSAGVGQGRTFDLTPVETEMETSSGPPSSTPQPDSTRTPGFFSSTGLFPNPQRTLPLPRLHPHGAGIKEAILGIIRKIGDREGVGDLLAQNRMVFAETIGPEAVEKVDLVKKLAPHAYELLAFKGTGQMQAVGHWAPTCRSGVVSPRWGGTTPTTDFRPMSSTPSPARTGTGFSRSPNGSGTSSGCSTSARSSAETTTAWY